MHQRLFNHRFLLIALAAFGALAGCAAPTPGAGSSSAATATPNAPAGWSVYHGDHFTLAYPQGWSYSTPNAQNTLVVFTGPQSRDEIEVSVATGVPETQIADVCSTTGRTQVQLAGLSMRYEVAEGVHRAWSFFNQAHTSFALSAMDADESAAMQAQHDAILATFKPDNSKTGCP